MKLQALVWLLSQVALIPLIHGYPSGAPTSACSMLTPFHQYNKPQTTVSPYRVTATKSGDKIRVTISGRSDFRGFVLQARYANNPNRLAEGKFKALPEFSQTIDCEQGRQNTLTQVNRNFKSQIDTEWTPAAGINEEIFFRATVVKAFDEFWINLESSHIKVSKSENSEKNSRKSNSDAMYDDCFVNKGCFGYPADCVTDKSCEVFLSYTDSGDGIVFTMIGSLSSQNYMATALSMDNKMGEDGVTECFVENGRVIAQNSWNSGRSNSPQSRKPDGMYDWQLENGKAKCSWVEPYDAVFQTNSLEQKTFHLDNTTHYLLIAKGPMNNQRVGFHTGMLSSKSVNFSAYEMIESGHAHDAVKVHGAFMITGWVALVSLAILMARYFKNDWEDQMICGVKVWFAVHRGLMIAALAFIVVAFIVIFVYKSGWNYSTTNPHAILGCIATILGLLQPIMAAFRPPPNHKKRPFFNWLHWAVGNSAQIFAVVAMFFVPTLHESKLKQSFYWVLGVFVVVHCFFHLLFQLSVWMQEKKKNNEIKMHTLGSGRVAPSGTGDQSKSLAGNIVRGLLLGIYVIFLTVIMLALYALIGTA